MIRSGVGPGLGPVGARPSHGPKILGATLQFGLRKKPIKKKTRAQPHRKVAQLPTTSSPTRPRRTPLHAPPPLLPPSYTVRGPTSSLPPLAWRRWVVLCSRPRPCPHSHTARARADRDRPLLACPAARHPLLALAASPRHDRGSAAARRQDRTRTAVRQSQEPPTPCPTVPPPWPRGARAPLSRTRSLSVDYEDTNPISGYCGC